MDVRGWEALGSVLMTLLRRRQFSVKIDYLETCMFADGVLLTLSDPGWVQVIVVVSGLISDL